MRDAPNQAFFHYLLWEDWRNGLYGSAERESVIGECAELLSTPDLFEQVLADVAESWPYAAAQHLSDVYRNHQPWCGRAACNFEHGATVAEVNAAWFSLTPDQRLAANAVADAFTYAWRTQHMPGQMRLPV